MAYATLEDVYTPILKSEDEEEVGDEVEGDEIEGDEIEGAEDDGIEKEGEEDKEGDKLGVADEPEEGEPEIEEK